jgi:aryl-alcohol dehydrogenase-like predicted oxidoreductase
MGHNETLVGRAMASYGGNTDDVVIATKGGITRCEGNVFGRNAKLSYLREAVEKSLRRLGVDVIDLYQWHRPDRSMVYADAIANFKALQDEGKIKAVGISNANVEEIQIAVDVLGGGGLVGVPNEFSLSSAAARTSSTSARSGASPSCLGARSVAPAGLRGTSASSSRRSRRSVVTTA